MRCSRHMERWRGAPKPIYGQLRRTKTTLLAVYSRGPMDLHGLANMWLPLWSLTAKAIRNIGLIWMVCSSAISI